MKIELRKIQFSERMSEETNCFVADLYIDGKKVGYAKNDGHGGCTDYGMVGDAKNLDVIKKAEAYCKTLPKKSYTFGQFDMNLEEKIDELFEEWLKEKDKKRLDKKLQKDMLKGLCYRIDNGYTILTWTGHTINSMLQHPQGKKTLQLKINQLKEQGKEILNTNLPQDILV